MAFRRTTPSNWDEFMDALGRKPAWAQYQDQRRVETMIDNIVRTRQQLARYGVPYPERDPDAYADSGEWK